MSNCQKTIPVIKLTFPQEILEDALKRVEQKYNEYTKAKYEYDFSVDNENSYNTMNTARDLNVATSDKEEEDYRALIYKQNIKLEGMKQQYKEQEYYDMLWNQYLQSRSFTEKGA